MERILERAARIKLAVFDIDGVFTDGGLFLNDNGEELKRFHAHDGLGLVLLQKSNCKIAVITARSSEIVAIRMKELGIEHIYQNQTDKAAALYELTAKLNLASEQVCYTGDDLVDLSAIQTAGLGIAVANAHPVIIQHADWITNKGGGNGAVREVCELILRAQGKYDESLKSYFKTAPVT